MEKIIARAPAEFRSHLDRADIGNVDGDTAGGPHDDLFDVLDVADQPDAADDVLHAILLDDLSAHVAVAALDGLDDVAQRNPVGG